ncbi:MAG: dual specificity protein phosphatase family protein [bacterium]|nr:dual specificity protein phosphatase family protein [bacterium]
MLKSYGMHVSMNYSKVTDSLYLGTNFCCQTHFDEGLMKLGVTIDVSLEAERIDSPQGVEAYLWLPTEDHMAPTQHMLSIGAKFMKNVLDAGDKVYIHCKNGHGRAPTMTAAYFIQEGKSLDEAIEIIKSARPEIHIEDVQEDALKIFEQNYLDKG